VTSNLRRAPTVGVPDDSIRNHRLAWRGTVEGFYGPPWSHEARLAHLEFAARIGLNTYVYAPKDDPYHRERWREPYPPAELGRLAALATAARGLGIRFVHTISPALSMRFAEDAEHAVLAAKAKQLLDAGVTAFGLLFDDVPQELGAAEDVARFGAGFGGCGAAHGETCSRFVADFLSAQGIEDTLLVCPTDYAGTDPSPYRDEFARTAPADVLIAWTGADIVVGAVSGMDIDLAAASYRRPVLLWDNFPVNDFDPTRLFLGPLINRAAAGGRAALRGIISNPMPQEASSRIALATVADWARDPGGYDPVVSARTALDRVAGVGAPALAPLVRACRAWPPDADQDPELRAAVGDALDGASEGLDVVADRLAELSRGCRAASEPEPLVTELRPWLDGAVATAEAGLAAVRLLRSARAGASAEEVELLRRETRQALDAAEEHYRSVLRPIVPPFVRTALDRTAPAVAGADDGRPVAVLLTGPAPSPGDRAAAELIEACGFAVLRTGGSAADVTDGAALVVVSGTAEPAAIASVAATDLPLLTWRATVDLGLARARRTVLLDGRIEILDPADPLAAGRHGVLSVLRGPVWLTVGEVDATQARVVARTPAGDAAIFHYPTGSRLVDGTPAPAPRIGLFLGGDGPARWLLTEDGRALVAAALHTAVDGVPPTEVAATTPAAALGPPLAETS
jgi:hypothetical protein